MANVASKSNKQSIVDTEYGVELKEVDFKEFDRRKAPRLSNYDAFVKSLESTTIEIEFIV